MSHALLALAVSALPAQEPAAAPDPLAKLVPARTVAYVQASSLARLETVLRRALPALVQADLEGFDVDAMLAGMGLPGSAKEIDHARPFALCFVLPEGAPFPPTLTFLVPANSPMSFLRSVRSTGARVMTAVEGNYVSISLGPGTETATSPAPIGLGLQPGDLVARIDVEGLVGRLRPALEASFAQLESAVPSAAGLKAIVESGRRLDAVATLDGDRLEIATALTVLDGSVLAGIGSGGKTEVRSLARFLDPDAWFGGLVGMDAVTLRKSFAPFLDGAFVLGAQPLGSVARKLLDRMPGIAEQAGSAACINTDLGDGSMRVTCYLRGADPVRVQALCEAALLDTPGISPDGTKEEEIDGARLRRLRFRVDTAAFVDAQLKGLGDEHKAELKVVYDQIYGANGLPLTLATKAGVTALVLGGDESFLRTSLARIPAGKDPPAAVARAIAQVGDLDPCFVVQYDVGRAMHGMNALIVQALPEWPFAIPQESAVFTAWGGVDGRVWRGAISTDLAQLESSFHRMQAVAVAAPAVKMKSDMDAIAAALIEYSSWHRGQFPPTLAPLLSPNIDHYEYLGTPEVPKDPWGREYRYDPPSPGAKDPRIYSYGKDGKVGGQGEDGDVEAWIRKGKRP